MSENSAPEAEHRVRGSAPQSGFRRRLLAGPLLAAIGAVHVVSAPVSHGPGIRSIRDGGVTAAVEAEAPLVDLRSAAFWYVAFGLAMLVIAGLVHSLERQTGAVPAWIGGMLVVISLCGGVLMPASGFWLILVVALLAVVQHQPARWSRPGPGPRSLSRRGGRPASRP